MNYKELLTGLNSAMDLILIRAEEFLRADGVSAPLAFQYFEINENSFSLTFIEDINYDCRDYFSVDINPEQLSMNDKDWKDYLLAVKEKRIEEFEKMRKEQKEAERLRLEETYQKLREKLGYND